MFAKDHQQHSKLNNSERKRQTNKKRENKLQI